MLPSSREATPHTNHLGSSISRPPPQGAATALSTSSSSHALFGSSIGSYGGPLADSTTGQQQHLQQLTSPTGQPSSGSFTTGTINIMSDTPHTHTTQSPPLPRGRTNPTVSFPTKSHPFHDNTHTANGDVHNTSSTAHMSSRTRSFSRNNSSNQSTPMTSPTRERSTSDYPSHHTQIVNVLSNTPSSMATGPPQQQHPSQHHPLNDCGGMARLASSSLSDIQSFGASIGPSGLAGTAGSTGPSGGRYNSGSVGRGPGPSGSSTGYATAVADLHQHPQQYSSSTDHSPRGANLGESIGHNPHFSRLLSPFSPRGGSTATDDSSRHQSESRNTSVQRQPLSANTSPRLAPVVGRTASTAASSHRNQHLFSTSTSASSVASTKTATYVPQNTKSTTSHSDPTPIQQTAPETVKGVIDESSGGGGGNSNLWSRSLSSHPGSAGGGGHSTSVNPSLPRASLFRAGASVRSPLISGHSQCNSPVSSNNNSGAALFTHSLPPPPQQQRGAAPASTSSRGGDEFSRSPSLQASTSFQPHSRIVPSISPAPGTVAPQRAHPALPANPAYMYNHRNSLTTALGQQALNSPTMSPTGTFQRHMQRHRFVTTLSDQVLTNVAPIAREWHPTPALSSLSAHQRLYLSSIELTAFTAVEKEILQLQDAYHAIYRAENATERRRRSGKKRKQQRRASACSAAGIGSGDWSKSPAISPKNALSRFASPHGGMKPVSAAAAGGGFFPVLSHTDPSAISSPLGQGGSLSLYNASMGIASEKAIKLVDIYIRTVLRLASMPIAFLSPQMGIVEYDVLVRRLRRTGYVSFELERASSPDDISTTPTKQQQQQQQSMTVLFAGHLKATLTAPTAIAIHKHTDALLKKRANMSPHQQSSTDLPHQPSITPALADNRSGQPFPPASQAPTTTSTTRSSSPNYYGDGGGVRAPGALVASPSMQTSTPRSIGGVSLMGKTHSNASLNLQRGDRRQSLPEGEEPFAFSHPHDLPKKTVGSLSSIPSNAASSSQGMASSGGDNNTKTYTYLVQATPGALEAALQLGAARDYPPDHTSPSRQAQGGGGGGGGRPGASDSAVFGGASAGALYDNQQGIDDTLAVSRRAGDVKWATPARPSTKHGGTVTNNNEYSPEMRPASNPVDEGMPPMHDYTQDPMGTITTSNEEGGHNGDFDDTPHPRSKSDVGLGVPIRSLDASETQHPDCINIASSTGSGGGAMAVSMGGNTYPGNSTLTFGSGYDSLAASNHRSQCPVMEDTNSSKVVSLARPFIMGPGSITASSIGRSAPQEILPPQNGSSLNTPHYEDDDQLGIRPTQQQQTQQQPSTINDNTTSNRRTTNSSGGFSSYHGGFSAPSGVPSFLSAANQFGDGGGGNLNSSNADDGEGDDDSVLRDMYGVFKDSDEEDGSGEEEES